MTPRLLRLRRGPRGRCTAPAAGNGRYVYGGGGGFPTGTWNATNYFVDVVFRATSRPAAAASADRGHLVVTGEMQSAGACTGDDREGTTDSSVAVVGAGYWGPNLVRNFRASRRLGPAPRCATSTSSGPSGWSARAAASTSPTSLDDVLARDDVDAVAIATPARTHQADRARRRSRPASTSWSRSRSPTAWRDGREMVALAARARPGADGRPHLLLHAGRAEDPRADRGRRPRRHPVRRLGADQPRPGPARRRRLLGPRAARPVDPRLRPPRRPASRPASRPTAPTRSAPASPASAT